MKVDTTTRRNEVRNAKPGDVEAALSSNGLASMSEAVERFINTTTEDRADRWPEMGTWLAHFGDLRPLQMF